MLRYRCNLIEYGRKQPTAYKMVGNQMFIKLSTLIPKNPLEIELTLSEYHKEQLENSRVTGGYVYKNNRRNRWEFHAYVREKLPIQNPKQKRAVLGIDLGINTDATVVVVREGEKLKQKDIHFFKEGDLRQKKFNIEKRKNYLNQIRDNKTGRNRVYALQELKALKGKITALTSEICHRISRKISVIAQTCLDEGLEVHVVIGRLRGLQNTVRKGNGESKKSRSRKFSFPYAKLTRFITYKCYRIGVEEVHEISEIGTSKKCHRCESTNTDRPTQAQFICNDCGLQYNADVNGALNICKKYIKELNDSETPNSDHVTMIFSSRKSAGKGKSIETSARPQRISDSPSYDELTGTEVQVKVEEVSKETEC